MPGTQPRLTIGQLASYAGVTVRAVRHYHARGLLPEPARDQSGYRRYDARAVADLIRIRTLSGAGVPLSRVQELLAAGPEEFARAVADIDRRLRAEIRERRRHRNRIAQLVTGDSLVLPPDAVAFFARMAELGFSERLIEIERDSWILIAAQVPAQVPAYMALKRRQIEEEPLQQLYRDIAEVADCAPDDPRLPKVVDRLIGFLEQDAADSVDIYAAEPLSEELVVLLDAVFVESFPSAARLLELLEERGWVGWTNIEHADP